MASRPLPEWIAKAPDSAIPARVKLRLFERCGGRCEACTTKFLGVKNPEYDHIIALVNGGENREANLQVVCPNCHKGKTRLDVSIKSRTARIRAKHLGIRKARQPIQSRGFQRPSHKFSRAQNRMVER